MPLRGDTKRRWDRDYRRTKRYGNWRQIYSDANGMCEGIVSRDYNDEVICGEAENLEFHECYNEEGKVVKIKLLCKECHSNQPEHNHRFTASRRCYPSMLQEDIQREIEECGEVDEWKSKYHIL